MKCEQNHRPNLQCRNDATVIVIHHHSPAMKGTINAETVARFDVMCPAHKEAFLSIPGNRERSTIAAYAPGEVTELRALLASPQFEVLMNG